MVQEFRELNNRYRNNEFEQILTHELGIYFLKMRSVSRVPILRRLAERANINVEGIQGRQLFEHLHIPEGIFGQPSPSSKCVMM